MNSVDPRFIVVLCSCNGASFIEEQLTSILAQGDSVRTVHVHDFASSDGTRAILERMALSNGDRIAVTLHEDAPGASRSFIRALRLTLPDLDDQTLVFLADQDDVWLPRKLETVKTTLVQRGISTKEPFLLFHDVKVVDQDLCLMRPTYYTGNPFLLPRDLDFSRLILANPAIGHTMLVSRPLIAAIVSWPGIDQYMMHDWLAVLIARRMGRIEYLPQALSLYRQHNSNVLGAYRTHRQISLTRLLRYADNLVQQAVAFSRAIEEAGDKRPPASRLETWCRAGYRAGAFALSIGAFTRGPTWTRKAIGALLLARAIVGPVDTARHEGQP